MKTIELINLLQIIERSIDEMDSEYKRIRFNLILIKLRKKLISASKQMTPAKIRRKVGEFYDIPEDYHENKTRKREYVQPRQQAMFIIYRMFPKKSLQSIGNLFGKDHTTVLHAKKTVNNLIDTDRKYRLRFEDLLKCINDHES